METRRTASDAIARIAEGYTDQATTLWVLVTRDPDAARELYGAVRDAVHHLTEEWNGKALIAKAAYDRNDDPHAHLPLDHAIRELGRLRDIQNRCDAAMRTIQPVSSGAHAPEEEGEPLCVECGNFLLGFERGDRCVGCTSDPSDPAGEDDVAILARVSDHVHAPEEECLRCGLPASGHALDGTGTPTPTCDHCRPIIEDSEDYDRSGGVINVQCYACGHEWSSMTLADPCPKCGDLPEFEDADLNDADQEDDRAPRITHTQTDLDEQHRIVSQDGTIDTTMCPACDGTGQVKVYDHNPKPHYERCCICDGYRLVPQGLYDRKHHPDPAGEDDVAILARVSDHVLGESAHAAELDQHRRDGQLWATHDPARARALLADPVQNGGNEFRRAWLDGIAYGLEHGTKGLRPRMELEETHTPCDHSGPQIAIPGAFWANDEPVMQCGRCQPINSADAFYAMERDSESKESGASGGGARAVLHGTDDSESPVVVALPTVDTYSMKAWNGSGKHVRMASRVTFPDGFVVAFEEKLPKGVAITQAEKLRPMLEARG